MSINSYAQKTIKPDLSNASRFQLVNREISITQNDNKKNVVHLNGVPNAGIAWINNLEFEKGVIELQKQIVLKFLSGSVEWYENFDTI